MQSDQLCVVTWRNRPRSFVSLMTLYESNFIRLGWLVRDLRALPGQAVSSVGDGCDLHLSTVERSRYTTTLSLTYWFEEAGERIAEPNLELRIYHDARLLEACGAIDCRRHRDLAEFGSHRGPALDQRWMRNQMLNKWLEYCAERGHRFAVTAEP